MNRTATLYATICVCAAFAYLTFHFGLLPHTPAAPSPAQAAQAHTAGYWKDFKKPQAMDLRQILTDTEFNVTQQDGTEQPFYNAYFDNEAEGIYVDIVSGEPLFSSKDKFDSGTGWPSFTKPLESEAVTLHTDTSLGVQRTEVRSHIADSHLGHLFSDGPAPLGTRYCMNSAALRFIPRDQLTAEGYSDYVSLFK